jgi:hypothetical protein
MRSSSKLRSAAASAHAVIRPLLAQSGHRGPIVLVVFIDGAFGQYEGVALFAYLTI